MTEPHIGNLRKRAAALGLEIVKAWGPDISGFNEYVIYDPQRDPPWEHCPMVSLYGVRAAIEAAEASKA